MPPGHRYAASKPASSTRNIQPLLSNPYHLTPLHPERNNPPLGGTDDSENSGRLRAKPIIAARFLPLLVDEITDRNHRANDTITHFDGRNTRNQPDRSLLSFLLASTLRRQSART